MKQIKFFAYNKFEHSSFDESFTIDKSSIYLFEVTSSAKSWWQNTFLRRSFLQKDSLTIRLNNQNIISFQKKRKLLADDLWNGNILQGSNQTVYVFAFLESGLHSFSFLIHGKPFLAHLKLYLLNDQTFELKDLKSEKRERTPWFVFLFHQTIALTSLSITAKVDTSKDDDDDLQLKIDDETVSNQDVNAHKEWYWCGKILKGATKIFRKEFSDSDSPNRIDIVADGMPVVDVFTFEYKSLLKNLKQPRLYKLGSNGEDYNKYDSLIRKVVHHWNNEFLKKEQPIPNPLEPDLVKALAYVESRIGYGSNTVDYPAYPDIMQVGDPRNPALHTLQAEKGFKEREWDDAKKTSTIMIFDKSIEIKEPRDSLYWGVRWLYHKAQYIQDNQRKWKTWEKAVEGYHTKGDARYRDSVMKLYKKGTDQTGLKIWLPIVFVCLLTSATWNVFGLSRDISRVNKFNQTTVEILKNGKYRIDGKDITLMNGLHMYTSVLSDMERREINPYDNYRGPYSVRYEQSAVGDLNGDGIKDGVVVLGVNYGGTGQYVRLAAVLFGSDGMYQHVGSYVFEDRDVVKDIFIKNNVVEVSSVLHSENDPLCCPTRTTLKKLILTDFK